MLKIERLFFLIFSICPLLVGAQTSQNYAVMLCAKAQVNPPSIRISVFPDPLAQAVEIYRRTAADTSWGPVYGSMAASDTLYVDNNVQRGVEYEYRFRKLAAAFFGFGYVSCTIDPDPDLSHKTFLTIIENRLEQPLTAELNRFWEDLALEGWHTLTFVVDSQTNPATIRDSIIQLKQRFPELKAALLVGRVPVPYSGNMAPDGHTNNHEGAWPADVYYGVISGIWTDQTVNNTTASRPANHNVPGDGKFDQNEIPGIAEIAIGRLDFSRLTLFSQSELDLFKRYFDKNHRYRKGEILPGIKTQITDNFGSFGGEAFAASAWRGFSVITGRQNIQTGNYIQNLLSQPHLMAYGCGAGDYTVANGIVAASNFASDSLNAAFSFLFGSYFGDWDVPNNLMRAALGSGICLSVGWSGRPIWNLHPLATGKTMGDILLQTQNNPHNLYISNYGNRFAHIALLGDPSLSVFNTPGPSNIQATAVTGKIILSWAAVPDVSAYVILRKLPGENHYDYWGETLPSVTVFTDSCLGAGSYQYLVRPIFRYNRCSAHSVISGRGIRVQAQVQQGAFLPLADFQVKIAGDTVSFENLSVNASGYFWSFGDGATDTVFSPVHLYPGADNYPAFLVAFNNCYSDTFHLEIDTRPNTIFSNHQRILKIVPNPFKENFSIEVSNYQLRRISIFGLTGQLLFEQIPPQSEISLRGFNSGIYFLEVETTDGQRHYARLVKS